MLLTRNFGHKWVKLVIKQKLIEIVNYFLHYYFYHIDYTLVFKKMALH